MSYFPLKQIKTKQNVNLCISNTVFEFIYDTEQVGYIHFSPVKICHLAKATASPNSHHCVPVLAAQTSSFSKHKGGTVCIARQAAVLWRESLLLINNTKPWLCPCRCLCASREKFLNFNCAIMGLMLTWCSTRKFYMLTIKRKEPCLHNTICFAFLPLLMIFTIYNLFWNCFQASSFLES